jgi:ribosome-binding protein aMBF1 (putative translation factor)
MGVRRSAKTHLDERAREAGVDSAFAGREKPRAANVKTSGLLVPNAKLPVRDAKKGGTPDAGQIQKRFGGKVREARQRKGISQEGLALMCGLDRAYVGGVERGERNISLVNIYKIAGGLGIPARELMP